MLFSPLHHNGSLIGSAENISIFSHGLKGQFSIGFASVYSLSARGFVIQNIGLQVVILAVSVALVRQRQPRLWRVPFVTPRIPEYPLHCRDQLGAGAVCVRFLRLSQNQPMNASVAE
jgi:hypothetical protein